MINRTIINLYTYQNIIDEECKNFSKISPKFEMSNQNESNRLITNLINSISKKLPE